jgi:catechol-2,3-dioxygenase
MNTPLYGIVLKVRNLELMRFFYRDVLELGAPQSDSNFWVEFNLGDGVPLILEKALEDEAVPESAGRVSWIFKVDEIDAVIERLKLFGYDPKHDSTERIGLRLYEFHDPEGNPFLVSANASKDKAP